MEQKQKNSLLIVVLLLLVVACIWAAQFNPFQKDRSEEDLPTFKIALAEEKITEVIMRGPKEVNHLKKTRNGAWTLNDSLSLDPAMHQVLMALLSSVEVQREVTGALKDEVLEQVADTGIDVRIMGEGLDRSFRVGGNPKQVNSYFVLADQVYLMQLPGYESYVAGMFEVKTLDWRNRSVLNASWQDITKMEVTYPNGESIQYAYEKGLIKMQQAPQADSVKVMDYVEQFSYFYVDQFLGEQHPAVQQLDNFKQAGNIQINTLDESRDLQLQFYINPDFNASLVQINGKEWGAVQLKRYEQLFAPKASMQK